MADNKKLIKDIHSTIESVLFFLGGTGLKSPDLRCSCNPDNSLLKT